MPLYYFHIEDGISLAEELENLDTAKCEAVKLAGRMICDETGKFWDRSEWQLTVTDNDGMALFCLNFRSINLPEKRGFIAPALTKPHARAS
jgi:hypothetical protein